ncbi:M1 family metallopeptidase [Gaoshiqia sp. Z1-71]|uniref:M1 family metallopeptidase n=1 Tax=Gaoshiqia hydrogeniformans TaxID=3290090 RepID=UPI003BF8E1EB
MKEINSCTNKLKVFLLNVTIRQMMFICLFYFGSFSRVLSQEYFQQEVNYNIQVSLNDKRHELNASETIEYINNSPDTLYFLYFHLWPNAYSGNNTPLAKQLFRLNGKARLFDIPELKGYIDSLDFNVNGKPVHWNLLPDLPDICRILLNEPLFAGDTILISTPFRVKIPKGVTSRLGYIEQSYQISQWYPKPAVYDQDGWHEMSYLDQGEFYSEFGNFNVSITLPDNYIVSATGNLQNRSEIEMLTALAADTSWIKTINIHRDDFPVSSEQVKTLHYIAEQVHDFAWFADKRFHVLKGNVTLPESGREITTWAMFTNKQAHLWKESLNYANDAISYYSTKVGDYPYQNFTVVQSALSAGLGMEYPGITVIGLVENAYSLDEVIAHEICHNWFYSSLGFNERLYPFMDEGITSAYTARYMNEKYSQKKFWEVWFKNRKPAVFLHIDQLPVKRLQELEWLVQARSNLEQPMNLPATEFSDLNYSIILYNKTAIAFNYLRAYLGDSLFDAAMYEHYHNWIFRHPRPDDLRTEFENLTDKDLTWFFDDLIGTTKRLDYKMVRVENKQLLVKNKGKLVSPLVIAGMTGDSIFFEKWVDGFAGQKWIELPEGDYTEIKIDPRHEMPEIFRMNNNIRKTGAFPKADPIQTQLLFTVDDSEKHTLMYFPAINWTRENGFMAGLALHNGFIIPKPVEYFVMPFYAFGNNDLAGFGKVTYNITPYAKFVRLAAISFEGTQFGAPANQNYKKLKTGVDLYFRSRNMSHSFSQKVFGNYIAASSLYQIELGQKAKMSSYLQFGYRVEQQRSINPFSLQATLETGKSYQKTSLEFNYKISYYGLSQGLDIRFFAGTMLKNESDISFYAFSAGGRTGREQYLYQGSYPDRFAVFPTNFWSRQMSLSEGGLVSPVNDSLGFSQWIIALSFTSNLPEKINRLPVKPFVNLLLNDHTFGKSNDSPIFFETGLKAGIWDLFEIHFPLVVSKNIDLISGPFKNRIRFVFSLDSIKKLKMTPRK